MRGSARIHYLINFLIIGGCLGFFIPNANTVLEAMQWFHDNNPGEMDNYDKIVFWVMVIYAGAAALLSLIFLLICCCCAKSARRQAETQEKFEMEV